MSDNLKSLLALIAQVRRRWRLKSVLRGLAVCSAAALALFSLAVFVGRYFNFSDAAVWTLRILAVSLFAIVLVVFLVLPAMRRVSNLQVARFIEENNPNLEQRLSSAVELGPGRSSSFSPFILRRLVEDALTRCHRVDLRELISGRAILSYSVATAAGFLILVGILSFGPPYVPYGAARLFASWTKAADQLPFKIHVFPGNTTVRRGSDLEVRATFEGFAPDRARIFSRDGGTQTWSVAELRAGRSANTFGTMILNLLTDRDYFVEADGFKSDSYRLKVEDLPRVTQIDLTYQFPAYTGMAPQHLENQGNMSALRGTRVQVLASLSMEATGGKMLLNDGTRLAMVPGDKLAMSGEVVLSRNGSYVLQLADHRGQWRVASDEYQIEALEDQPPQVTLSRPGRDYRASRIEEVFVEAKASDDLRVTQLDLHYSINGKEEQVLPLYQAARGSVTKTVTAGHTFYLEELPLKVGDVISYYAQASDGNPNADTKKAASDLFFLEVASFDKSYSQSQERGQQGGGGSPGALTRQEKDIIAATWRLIRDQGRMEKREFSESVRSVALIQAKLRDQTAGLATTISTRMGPTANPDMARLGKMLEAASVEMQKAESALSKLELQQAMPFEQAALTKLLEAESLYKEIQVQFSTSGSPDSEVWSNWEDLSELFELELNRIKNQYETLKQDAVRKREENVDEALRKLRELAQRQEQLLERQRRMQAQQGPRDASAGGGMRSEALQRQQELAEQAENLKRRLEQLAREKPEDRMPEVSRSLQQASEQMKRALQEMRSSQDTNASLAGTKALQQLQEAERLLNSSQSGRSEKTLERLKEAIQSLQADEAKIQEELERLAARKEEVGSSRSEDSKGRILDRKDMMVEKLDAFESELVRASQEMASQQKEANRKLAEARSMVRERRIRDKILEGKGFVEKSWLDFAKAREDNIARDLKDLGEILIHAQGQLASNSDEKMQRALNQTRDLVDSLESLKNRLDQLGGQGRQQDRQQSRQQGQQDSQQQGRQGDQQGQNQQGEPSGRGTDQDTARLGGRDRLATGGPAPDGRFRPDANPTRLTPEQLRQLQREYEERLRQAQGIVPYLRDNKALSEELERLLGKMRSINRNNLGVAPGVLAQLQRDILDPLKQFEVELSRQLNELSTRNKLHRLSEDDVPPAFRKMVEDYFKKIAVKDKD